jgi:hypothetical protein
LAHKIAHRIGRYLERQGWLERDAENDYPALDATDDDPLSVLQGHSIAYGIVLRPLAGRQGGCIADTASGRKLPDEATTQSIGNRHPDYQCCLPMADITITFQLIREVCSLLISMCKMAYM